jgi:non-heme chloroperoxidase
MKRLRQLTYLLIVFGVACTVTLAGEKEPHGWRSGFVNSSDGVKIHYVEAGRLSIPASVQPSLGGAPGISVGASASHQGHEALTILFVPGWTMSEWIWDEQIEFFSKGYHVIAMDPRSQGESTQTGAGLFPAARASDIKVVIDQLHLAPVVLVGWSMAVTEVAAYVDQFGTKGIAGFVLVDGAVGGFSPGDAESDFSMLKGVLEDRSNQTDAFVRKLCFHKPHPEDYVKRVIDESLKVPTTTAVALLVGYMAADYRAALSKFDKPTLIIAAKSGYADYVVAIQKQIPDSKIEVFDGVGHALFVDDPDHFNSVLLDFIRGPAPAAH